MITGGNGDSIQLIAFLGGSGHGDGITHGSFFGLHGDLAVFDLFIYGNGVDGLLEGSVQNHICLGHCEGISAVLICGDLLCSFTALSGIGQLLQLVAGVGSHCDGNSIVPRECGRCGDGAVLDAFCNGYGIGELLEGGVNGDGLSRHIQRVAIVNCLNRMVLVRALGGVIELLQRIALSGRDGDRNGGADCGGFGLYGDHAVCDALCHCDVIGDCLEGGGNGDCSCGHGERVILIERDLGRALLHGDGVQLIAGVRGDGNGYLLIVLCRCRGGDRAICGLYGDLIIGLLEGGGDGDCFCGHGKGLGAAIATHLNLGVACRLHGDGIQHIACGGFDCQGHFLPLRCGRGGGDFAVGEGLDGNGICRGDTIIAVYLVGNAVALCNCGSGGSGRIMTARDFKIAGVGFSVSPDGFTSAVLDGKGAAGDGSMRRGIGVLVLCSHECAGIGPVRCRCGMCKGAVGNSGGAIGQHNAIVGITCSVTTGKVTAVDGQCTGGLALYGVHTTGVGATMNGQGPPVVDHGGSDVSGGGSHIGKLNGTGGIGLSAALDVIVACAAHNGTVLYGNCGVVANEQGSLAAAGVGQGLAAQIQSQLFAGDRDILSGIGHQRYGIVILSGCDSLCQGGVLVFTNGCHGILHGYGVKTIFTGNRLIIFREII